MLVIAVELAFLFVFSMSSLFFLRKVAIKIGLVDAPNMRKLHNGSIPLVGGLAICISLLYFVFNNPNIIPHSDIYATSVIVLVMVGVLDDKYDIDYKIRFLVQAGLSIWMLISADIELKNLGNILGLGKIRLGLLGYVITMLAVIAAINAFNMVDGIDGLLGGLSIVTIGGLGLMLFYDGQSSLAYFCLVLVVILIPYIILNLEFFGIKRKIFMGDAGSMLIGFTVVWLLLLSSQNSTNPPIRPVTALWLIAVPLMDMAATMLRRVKRGDSPFKPDREHLHHIFQRLGFSSSETLLTICAISLFFSAIGMIGEVFGIPEYVMFYIFVMVFFLYVTVSRRIWRFIRYVKINFMRNDG